MLLNCKLQTQNAADVISPFGKSLISSDYIWFDGHSVHAHRGSFVSDAIQTERWVSINLHWLNGCSFNKWTEFFLCCGAVRSSTPSHPFTTPTTWSRPTAWVSPTWCKLNQMPATVRYTNLPVWVSLWVQMGHNICWLMKLQNPWKPNLTASKAKSIRTVKFLLYVTH